MFGYTYADLQAQDIAGQWDQSYRWSLQSSTQVAPPSWMAPVDFHSAQVFRFQQAAPAVLAALPQKVLHSVNRVHAVVHNAAVVATAPAKSHTDAQAPEAQTLLKSQDPSAQPVVQWYVDTAVERDALDGAFTVYFFLGTAEEMRAADAQPTRYATAPIMAGLTKVFTAPREACDACHADAAKGVVVTGTNPVTPMLRDYIRHGRLTGLGAAEVTPFLQKNLHWRVVASNAISHDPSSVAGLKVSVSSTVAVYRPGEARPVTWEAHKYPDVTQGHVNGDPPAGHS